MMSAATGISIPEYAALFDSVYISMYKYFGAPFGAILAGPQEFIEGMYHDRRMFGSGLSSAYLPAALALRGMDGFEQRFGEAMSKAGELFDTLNHQTGIAIRRFEHGSNIVELDLADGLDAVRFFASLLKAGIVVAPPSADWSVALLHVNTTILRKPNQEIAEAFASAAAAAKTLVKARHGQSWGRASRIRGSQ
jgi:threonine aldolase